MVAAVPKGVRNSTRWLPLPGAIEDGMSKMDFGEGAPVLAQFAPGSDEPMPPAVCWMVKVTLPMNRNCTTAPPGGFSPAPAPAAENAEVAEDSSEGGGSPAHGPLVEPIADSGPAEKVPLLGGASKRVAQGKPVAGRKGKSPAAAHAQGSQASLAKPNAPPALAAQGYVALNHRQPAKAIGLFKRALASNPNNGTALFGLAEAYRTANQHPAALQAYRRYVELLPSGPDAGSARFQIRTLESKKR